MVVSRRRWGGGEVLLASSGAGAFVECRREDRGVVVGAFEGMDQRKRR